MLRRILLASAAMALAGAADAADLPTGASPVYLPPPPVFTWTGFYAGLNAGYTFGGSNSVDVETHVRRRHCRYSVAYLDRLAAI